MGLTADQVDGVLADVSAVETTLPLASYPLWYTIRLVNSVAISTLEASSDPPWMVPRPPVPGRPMFGAALAALSMKVVVADGNHAVRVANVGQRPGPLTLLPSEYCARMEPPSPEPTLKLRCGRSVLGTGRGSRRLVVLRDHAGAVGVLYTPGNGAARGGSVGQVAGTW